MNVELGADYWDAPHRSAEATQDCPSGWDQPLIFDEKVALFRRCGEIAKVVIFVQIFRSFHLTKTIQIATPFILINR
jgi:hypothetical protein